MEQFQTDWKDLSVKFADPLPSPSVLITPIESSTSDPKDPDILTEDDAWDTLGYSFPSWRKWQILMVVFCIQISINLNASIYANAVPGVIEKYGISESKARIPQMTFLIAYGFGMHCVLLRGGLKQTADIIEKDVSCGHLGQKKLVCLNQTPLLKRINGIGRWPIQQASLLLVNIWQIPCAIATNFETYIIFRTLGGLSTAGGSVTLGVLADMWKPADQGYAVALLVLSSVSGSVLGGIVGGFVEEHKPLAWIFWVQLIVGVSVQLVHLVCNPETRATILLDREAKRRRAHGQVNVFGPKEIQPSLKMRDVWKIWYRPLYMFFTEPIVLWLSLLSGFSDALIFTFLESFGLVYRQWGFDSSGVSLALVP